MMSVYALTFRVFPRFRQLSKERQLASTSAGDHHTASS